MITDVLFDLDDTLCDFSGAMDRGLELAFGLLQPDRIPELTRLWRAINPYLFAAFAAGDVTLSAYRRLRFELPITAAMPPAKATQQIVEKMNGILMCEINERIRLFDGALACLEALRSKGFRCHILTNGPADGQRRKIGYLGLEPFISRILIGQEIGAFKPDVRAFDAALSAIGTPAEGIVMVGNSLTEDILPARSRGLNTVLLGSDPLCHECSVTNLSQVPAAIINIASCAGSPDGPPETKLRNGPTSRN